MFSEYPSIQNVTQWQDIKYNTDRFSLRPERRKKDDSTLEITLTTWPVLAAAGGTPAGTWRRPDG